MVWNLEIYCNLQEKNLKKKFSLKVYKFLLFNGGGGGGGGRFYITWVEVFQQWTCDLV